MKSSKAGFTLVELSIVLVIIGLLIGGILVGQSLVETAKVNRFVSEVQGYEIASKLFRERFSYWPGDHPNGYGLFGSDCGSDNDPATPTWNGANGNGNYRIHESSFSEANKYWCHLSRSGLLGDESYDWMNVGVDTNVVPGSTTPLFSIDEQLTAVAHSNSSWLYGVAPSSMGTNGFWLGACFDGGGCSNQVYFPVLYAMALDNKVDDGRPGTGIIQPYVGSADYGTYCVTTGNPLNSEFIPDDERGCILTVLVLNEDQAQLH